MVSSDFHIDPQEAWDSIAENSLTEVASKILSAAINLEDHSTISRSEMVETVGNTLEEVTVWSVNTNMDEDDIVEALDKEDESVTLFCESVKEWIVDGVDFADNPLSRRADKIIRRETYLDDEATFDT